MSLKRGSVTAVFIASLLFVSVWAIGVEASSTDAPEKLWDRTHGGDGQEIAWSTIQTADGGYALAGQTSSFGVSENAGWLVKTGPDGIEEWNRTYDGSDSEHADAVIQTADGGYALAGQTRSFGNGWQFWLVRTAPDGTERGTGPTAAAWPEQSFRRLAAAFWWLESVGEMSGS